MNVFCTYCDAGYAARMRCLHESLREQGEPFRLVVLCFDAGAERAVAGAGDASLVALPVAELLAADPGFAAVRERRTRVEWFFTATPVLVRHCFVRETDADVVTYLDADLFFYAPPSRVLAEQGDASVGIVPHRFPRRLAPLTRHGVYNVGWVSFRRDVNGLAAVEWWRERCLEWCHDRVEDGRFADQGYLNEFPRRFAGVRELTHAGINTAPWNVDGSVVTTADGRPRVGGAPVLFYHYQGVREVEEGVFDPGLGTYRTRLTRGLRDAIYMPYLRRLSAMQEALQREHGIEPVRGYLRVPTTRDWRGRWERFRASKWMVAYRRLRGRLIRVMEPAR